MCKKNLTFRRIFWIPFAHIRSVVSCFRHLVYFHPFQPKCHRLQQISHHMHCLVNHRTTSGKILWAKLTKLYMSTSQFSAVHVWEFMSEAFISSVCWLSTLLSKLQNTWIVLRERNDLIYYSHINYSKCLVTRFGIFLSKKGNLVVHYEVQDCSKLRKTLEQNELMNVDITAKHIFYKFVPL